MSDIDVFINDKDTLFNMISYMEVNYPVNELTLIHHGYFEEDKSGSVVNISLKNERVFVQFILLEYETPMEIIEGFDLDYVQCALHKNKLYFTDICRASHLSRKVEYATEFPPPMKRLMKAVEKGFSAPVFGNSTNSPVMKKFNRNESELKYIKRRDQNRGLYKLSETVICAATSELPKKWKTNIIYDTKFTVKNNGIEANVKHVPLKIKMERQRFEKNKYYISTPDHPSLGIDRCILPVASAVSSDEEYIAVSNLFAFEIRKGSRIYLALQISMIGDIKILPLKVLDSLKIFIKDSPNLDIQKMIAKHSLCASQLSFIKKNAYECFLYNFKDTKDEKKAIKEACRQIVIDHGKMRKEGPSFALSSFAFNYCETVSEMIRFIEGFN